MKEELTKKMHSELKVSNSEYVKHKAGCVWGVLFDMGKVNDSKLVEHYSRLYGITYEQAMRWKGYWLKDM